MHEEFQRYQNLLRNTDVSTTPDELESAGAQLKDSIYRYHVDVYTLAMQTDEALPVPDEDLRVLKACTELPDPAVRREAIRFFCNFGPVTWDDVERWAADPDVDVCEAACVAVAYGLLAICDLCTSDLERCGSLFDLVFADDERFSDMNMLRSYYVLAAGDRDDLEAAWRGTGVILDLGRPRFSVPITVGFLEDAIRDKLTLGDPLVTSWVDGDSVARKMALLEVVSWFRLSTPLQRDIAQRLSSDHDEMVRDAAEKAISRAEPRSS